MRYAQINSKYVCGIDLHAREMYACVMNEKGEILFHRNMRTDFDQFKKNMCLVSAASQIPFYGIG
jgi:predicted NBD/HSP70 family sugar kinase